MTSETKEEMSKLIYDDRRKILHQNKSQITENKTDEIKEGDKIIEKSKLISTVKQSMEVDYTEEGIRLAYDNLIKEKDFLIKRKAQIESKFKDIGEMPKDLKELKDKIDSIKNYDAAEKSKSEIESMDERLKEINKDITQINSEIGDRLKL